MKRIIQCGLLGLSLFSLSSYAMVCVSNQISDTVKLDIAGCACNYHSIFSSQQYCYKPDVFCRLGPMDVKVLVLKGRDRTTACDYQINPGSNNQITVISSNPNNGCNITPSN